MTQDSRHIFLTLLRSAQVSRNFRARLSMLLDNDPYFLPAYLEHIWYADMRGDARMRSALIRRARRAVWSILLRKEVREPLNMTWTELELTALTELLDVFREHARTPFGLISVLVQRHLARHLLIPKTRTYSRTGRYLRLVKQLDVTPLQRELSGVGPYWWNVSTDRAEDIAYHSRTYAIILRYIPTLQLPYAPLDGVHESTPTFFAERFPIIHSTVLALAEELQLGLGRIAIVYLPPKSQAYRHYDIEPCYEGRERYHLVVEAGDKNFLSSGDETTRVSVGDVWFFDNKVMHRAHNKADVPRVHVIFDGYPLRQEVTEDEIEDIRL